MSDDKEKDIDAISGVETTGHEWDGLKELNNPLPKWWLWCFYGTIIWTVVFTIFFPAWPMITDNTKGLLGYTTRGELVEIIEAADAEKAVFTTEIAALDFDEITAKPDLLQFARAGGAAAFKNNCSQCHGAGAAGFVGYPNLQDDDWLWGGSVEEIHHTISHGVRVKDAEGYDLEETRQGDMPAFGRDELLEKADIEAVAEFVLKLSGQAHDASKAEAGAVVFEENCSSCHAENGEGDVSVGAPNLTDAIWLYGGDRDTILEGLHKGRAGAMPAWSERLDEATVKQLALYVHGLGGGE